MLESLIFAVEEEDYETREHRRKEIDPEERARLKAEFLKMMQERFLGGLDADFFDYTRVDNDDSLQDLRLRQLDEEEAYFDTD